MDPSKVGGTYWIGGPVQVDPQLIVLTPKLYPWYQMAMRVQLGIQ
jgi:hypothetical protein